MIFVTVGTDQPFDRLIKVVDHWVYKHRRLDVIAQVGKGGWKPLHMRSVDLLAPSDYAIYMRRATTVVSHAGMGTILSALHHGKPILVMPKIASLGEHRNEHQTATARRLLDVDGIRVAFDEDELIHHLSQIDELKARSSIGDSASDELIDGIRSFIFNSKNRMTC